MRNRLDWRSGTVAMLLLGLTAASFTCVEAAEGLRPLVPEAAIPSIQPSSEATFPSTSASPLTGEGLTPFRSQAISAGIPWVERPYASACESQACADGLCPSTPPCPSCCCGPPEFPSPNIYARFRFLALMRDGKPYVPFASLGEPVPGGTPDIALSSNDIEFPFQGGGEVTTGWQFLPTYFLEFTYFGLTSWDELAAYRDTTANSAGGNGDLFSPFGDFGLTPLEQFDYNNYAYVRYHSRMNNFELNLRHEFCMPPVPLNASFLFGGRAMLLDENFTYETTSDIPSLGGTHNLIGTHARNRLLGLQIGGLFEFHVDPCWWVNFEMKGGICQNKIGLNSRYEQSSGTGGTANYDFGRNDSNTSFVGELNLSFMYEHNQHLTAEVGYRAMWITGLALGTENLQTNPGILTQGPLNVVDSGDVVYHGPHAGVTVRW